MTKEIIVNAGELESRVAMLENGRLMELHLERDPKIVGNIYKGRVTKVLKGMDAAFVDIGIERNAFLSASDVVAQDDEEGSEGNGRTPRRPVTPITQLLKANQEILAQVVRAPMGTKGARITTRLSLPGRYLVLMLNSGTYVGVSRKIEDDKERHRLRAIANEIRPNDYSLIVRTEAEGKTEEELRQDVDFLVDMARRIEDKAAHTSAPNLLHGDLTLVSRLLRDAFTREVNRVVIDSPSAYEVALELVNMIAPRLKHRLSLYDDPTPIFHAYNIEPEIERTLRRKVWLPSGGSLIIDQAEALTAIDVNTGRFVGTIELAETVLTTNLQAAEEVARQLRLRDLGGIIVVDFIDMDNPKHRQQVMKAFEEALHRDRAKIKVHNISPLGLVEMTRKRTGDSLVGMLTEPCPYCSGLGRVQTPLTMALRIEREIAATAVEHKSTEAFLVVAHPRVIASMLGYEGEAQRDLELYLERPVYLRLEEDFHPNTYRLERLTLEQALAAVKHIEEGQVVEGQVVNPDPELSLSPLVQAEGIFLVVPELDAPVGARVKVRVTEAGTSLAKAEPLAAELRGIRTDMQVFPTARPPLVPEAILPYYLREERSSVPPQGLHLLSPTAEAVPVPEGLEEIAPLTATMALESSREKRRRRGRSRRSTVEEITATETTAEMPMAPAEEPVAAAEEVIAEAAVPVEAGEAVPTRSSASRRRRRRRHRGEGPAAEEIVSTGEAALDMIPQDELLPEEEVAAEVTIPSAEITVEPLAERPARRRRRRSRRREPLVPAALEAVLPVPDGTLETSISSPEEEIDEEEHAVVDVSDTPAPVVEALVETSGTRRRPRTRTRRPREHVAVESAAAEPVLDAVVAPPVAEPAPVPEVVAETPAEDVKPTRARRAPATRRPRRRKEEEPPAASESPSESS